MRLILKAWSYYREYGLVDFIRRIHRRRKFIVYVKAVERSEPLCKFPDVFFRVARPEDASLLVSRSDSSDSDAHEAARESFLAGDMAVIGLCPEDHSRLVYRSWLSSRGRMFNALLGRRPDSSEVCSKRVWVPEPYRRRGLAERGLKFAEHVAAEDGKNRMWAFVIDWNSASRKLHEKLGYERFGVLRVGRRWGKRFAEIRHRNDRRWTPLNVAEPGSDPGSSDASSAPLTGIEDQ